MFYALSPVAATLEEISQRWLVDILGLPRGMVASFVAGATSTNFTALAVARSAVLKRAG